LNHLKPADPESWTWLTNFKLIDLEVIEMKRIIIIAACLIMASTTAMAQVLTFSITSSASTGTPNLRIGYMSGPIQIAPGSSGAGSAMQTQVFDAVGNYYLTKKLTIDTCAKNARCMGYALIQTDQNTKLNFGTDLTNYLLIQSGLDFGTALRN
jgi:hypothetical protein